MSDLAWLGQSDVADVTGATVLHNLDDMTRADWLHARKSGLGGSDAAAILGVSPWTSGYTLWRDKTSDHTDDQSSLAMRRGTHLEPFILAEAMVADPDLTVYRAPYMLAHPDHPHLRANLDGLAQHAKRRTWGGVEAKNVNSFQAKHWADGPPAYYEAQVGHYLACCPAIGWWVVVADFGGDDLRVFYLDRESVPVATIVEREVAWWQRHMVDGVPVDPDGHAATTEAMKVYEPAVPEQVCTIDPGQARYVFSRIAEARSMAAMAAEMEAAAKNELRLYLGEASVLADEAERTWATWRRNADEVKTDWKAVASELAAELAEVRGQATFNADRPFIVMGTDLGDEEHTTLDEALADAESRIDDCLDDTWSEDVDQILVARVTHRAVRTVVGRRADMTPEAWTTLTGGRTDVDEWWIYSIEPVDAADQADQVEGAAPDDVLGQAAAIFTTTKPGARVLRVDAGLKNLKETTK